MINQRYVIEITGVDNKHNRFKTYLSGFAYYEHISNFKDIRSVFVKGAKVYVYRVPLSKQYKLINVDAFINDYWGSLFIEDYSLRESKDIKAYLNRIFHKKSYLHKFDLIKVNSVKIKKCKVITEYKYRRVVILSK